MAFHRHCFCWIRLSSDEIGNACGHCWDEGNPDIKVLGEWMEQEGDDERVKRSQAAFAKAHARGCAQNGGANMKAKRRPAAAFDWGA